MLRNIAQWYISRAVDCDESLPAWVERRLANDAALQQFRDQSYRLALRLRAANVNPILSTSEGADGARANRPRAVLTVGMVAGLAVGLAAVVLLNILPGLQPVEQRAVKGQAEPLAMRSLPVSGVGHAMQSAEVSRLETTPLETLYGAGRTFFQEVSQRANNLAQPASEVDQLAALWELDVERAFEPASELGAVYGEFLSGLDRQIEADNRRLISEGIGAWRFFVQKLPQSAASLVGL